MPDLSLAITLPIWLKAAQCPNQNYRPPESYLVLRDARARLRRDRYKYSTMFSGIAVEIVVKNHIERALKDRGNSKAFIVHILNGTLGSLENTFKMLSIDLPASTR